MGFIGSIRTVALRSIKNGVYDVKRLSDELVASAKRAAVNTAGDVSSFFGRKFVREVNGTPLLGDTKLFEFSRFAREGNFEQSFGKAFPGNAALRNPSVRGAIDRMLLESRRTLPDFRYSQHVDLANNAGKSLGVDPKTLKTADDLSLAVEANPKLKSAESRLLQRAKNNKKKIFLFGTSFTLVAVTAAALHAKAEELAAEESGCFAYWTDGAGSIHKCKVSPYSCKHGASGQRCFGGLLPDEILNNTDCQQEANREQNCVHCREDDPANVNLPENVMLKCEEKTAGDVLLEAISQTVGNVWSGVTSGLRSVFIYGTIFLVIVIVLVVIINLVR